MRILSVSALEEDHTALRAILQLSNSCEIDEAATCRTARGKLEGACVVISDAELPDGDWKDILDELWSLVDPPLLIVSSRFADERLWAEVLNLGGYDVLPKPFDTREVFRVVTGALLSSQRHSLLWNRCAGLRKPMARAAGAD